MANRKHLKILKQGVDAWNKWRKENLEIKPDLTEAKLYEADLSEADLFGVNLSGADLNGATLSGAKLIRADLKETELDGAILDNAIYDETTIFSDTLNQKERDKMGMILSKES